MIQRIYVHNYKCLVNFEWKDIPQVALVVGDNGNGKSSIFDAVFSLASMVAQQLDVVDVISADTLTYWQSQRQQAFELDVVGNGGTYTYRLTVEHESERSRVGIGEESLLYDGKPLFRYEGGEVHLYDDAHRLGTNFGFTKTKSFLGLIESRPENKRLVWFQGYMQGLWNARPLPAIELMDDETREEDPSLDVNASNFPSWYRFLITESPGRAVSLFQGLSEAVDGFKGLRLSKPDQNAPTRRLLVSFHSTHGGKPYEVPFDGLSDGQRQLIVLYTLIQAVGEMWHTLLLDEPDNFVAPHEIQPFLVALCDAVLESDAQVLVVSHHAETIDYLSGDRAFICERDKGSHVRIRPLLLDRESSLPTSKQLVLGWKPGG